jgi:hypothetical protein
VIPRSDGRRSKLRRSVGLKGDKWAKIQFAEKGKGDGGTGVTASQFEYWLCGTDAINSNRLKYRSGPQNLVIYYGPISVKLFSPYQLPEIRSYKTNKKSGKVYSVKYTHTHFPNAIFAISDNTLAFMSIYYRYKLTVAKVKWSLYTPLYAMQAHGGRGVYTESV